MTNESEEKQEKTEDLEQILQESSEKASKAAAKLEEMQKRNLEMKRLLRILPFQIFLLVADADGKIDPREVAGFKNFLDKRERHCSNPYTRRMFHATVLNYATLVNRYQTGNIRKSFDKVEKTITYIRLCVSRHTMSNICHDLRELAESVARSSGGFLGMTSPVSREESRVIEKLDAIFDNAILNATGRDKTGKWSLDF